MLRIGILGLGGMGRFHASKYSRMADVKLVAVANIDSAGLGTKKKVQMNIDTGQVDFDPTGIEYYPDAASLIEHAEVDVVDICLPSYLHAEYAIKAMHAGYHVLCEKPMALTYKDADEMVMTSHQTGRKLMIAQVLRFVPEYLYLNKAIQAGSFGRLISLNMWRISARPGWSYNNWFLDPKRSGGAILDLHIHDVDYVNSVFGLPDSLIASGRMSQDAKSYDVIHTVYSYNGGPQVQMHAGWSPVAIPFQSGFEAWFDKAFVSYISGKLSVIDESGPVELSLDAVGESDGFDNEIIYFLDCIRTKTEPTRCTPESTRDSLLLIEEELLSMRDNLRAIQLNSTMLKE